MSDKSQNSQFPTIERVFELLDRWRHLPAYQLERRADIFFALFLPEALGAHLSKQENCSVEINPTLIPEFPIKKKSSNQSIKADYLALQDGEPAKRAFLIELKTHMESINKKQIRDLKCTAHKGIGRVICGLKSIAASDSVARNRQIRGKYIHLLCALEALSLINIPDIGNFKNLCFRGRSQACPEKSKPDYYKCLVNGIRIRRCPELKVIYILPEEPKGGIKKIFDGVELIYFDSFANHAKERGSIGRRFAESLSKWKEPAVLCPPQA